jgi:hypothetical protein
MHLNDFAADWAFSTVDIADYPTPAVLNISPITVVAHQTTTPVIMTATMNIIRKTLVEIST